MMYRLRSLPEIEAAWQDRLAARRGGSGQIARRLAESGRLAAPFTETTAGDWIAATGSVMLWEELTRDLGWDDDRYVAHMAATFRATLLR
jgi:hypothetical protein